MREERSWTSKVMLMMSKETLSSTVNTEESTNFGISCTQMNGRENQERES
jgi:hypothetical protein